MSQQIRIYLNRPAGQGKVDFYEKVPKMNVEPGWPGTHHVEYELSQFFEDVPVMKKGVAKTIEESTEFVAASITSPIRISDEDIIRMRNGAGENETWMTVDTSERPYITTIWATTISRAIKQLQKMYPAP